jgi:hypothetical protein
VKEDAVVNEAVDSSGVQYAIIAALRTETGPERLVIEYTNQESLSDLIAAPSIIAAGFASREDAVASGRALAVSYRRALSRVERRGEVSSTLRRLARFLASSYGDAAVIAAVIFSSKSLLSTVIRTALGGSA